LILVDGVPLQKGSYDNVYLCKGVTINGHQANNHVIVEVDLGVGEVHAGMSKEPNVWAK
jgi:hypothetical protein